MSNQLTDTTSKIRKLLAMVLRDCDKSRQPVAEILELLDSIERITPRAGTSAGEIKRRYQPTEYHVEDFQGNSVLSEYREGIVHPFRCERTIYDATASALQGQHQGLQFDKILGLVAKKLGQIPPEYAVRVCLRFWLRDSAPLIRRAHSRYIPLSPSKFQQYVRARWKKLVGLSK